jgi:hypothetical protein
VTLPASKSASPPGISEPRDSGAKLQATERSITGPPPPAGLILEIDAGRRAREIASRVRATCGATRALSAPDCQSRLGRGDVSRETSGRGRRPRSSCDERLVAANPGLGWDEAGGESVVRCQTLPPTASQRRRTTRMDAGYSARRRWIDVSSRRCRQLLGGAAFDSAPRAGRPRSLRGRVVRATLDAATFGTDVSRETSVRRPDTPPGRGAARCYNWRRSNG